MAFLRGLRCGRCLPTIYALRPYASIYVHASPRKQHMLIENKTVASPYCGKHTGCLRCHKPMQDLSWGLLCNPNCSSMILVSQFTQNDMQWEANLKSRDKWESNRKHRNSTSSCLVFHFSCQHLSLSLPQLTLQFLLGSPGPQTPHCHRFQPPACSPALGHLSSSKGPKCTLFRLFTYYSHLFTYYSQTIHLNLLQY